MLKAADDYFYRREEPIRSCLLALRHLILSYDDHISEVWQYGMPFYCYENKRCLYLWTHKKKQQPYVGVVDGTKIDHPLLISEKRARMKIMLIDPEQDVPVETLLAILKQVLSFYG